MDFLDTHPYYKNEVNELYNKDEIMFECLKYLINSDYYIVFYLYDGSILTGHENGYIKQWDLNNNKLKLIGEKKVHDNRIRVISQLKNDLILSGSIDRKINFYKIE